jgi:uncharacterized protein YgbK (DUF1537 family)
VAKSKKQVAPTGWENRIVGSGAIPANQYLAHESNARRHPARQREALIGSLNSVGWVAPVIVSSLSGKVLDGHARIEEALTRDEHQLVPYVKVDVTESEEKVILAWLDPITGMAIYDKEALDALLSNVKTSDVALRQLLSDLAAKEGVVLSGIHSVSGDGQVGRKQKAKVVCPECGHKFVPRGNTPHT